MIALVLLLLALVVGDPERFEKLAEHAIDVAVVVMILVIGGRHRGPDF